MYNSTHGKQRGFGERGTGYCLHRLSLSSFCTWTEILSLYVLPHADAIAGSEPLMRLVSNGIALSSNPQVILKSLTTVLETRESEFWRSSSRGSKTSCLSMYVD